MDGDSFFLDRTEVRMQGIDAPEGKQTCLRDGRDWRCGDDSRRTLERLTGGQPIRCVIHSTDQHGRALATCFNASGINLNARMVAGRLCGRVWRLHAEEGEAKPPSAAYGPLNSSGRRIGARRNNLR